eukprot:TRINITY_DN3580_c0_g1_i2.p1 TRINITY_DN3580_c0_g1~~TRINITY_DN3580_c0_g1_i2.p1  ORF type:complete len:165 (-),score=54.87 TRINITY_DN3580_c0_g1_i2:121-615(-)
MDSIEDEGIQTQIKQSNYALQRLRDAALQAKMDLDHEQQVDINLPYLVDNNHVSVSLIRSQFETMCQGLLEKTLAPIDQCLADINIDKSDVDDVVLVGGMTRVPMVRARVSQYFDRDVHFSVDADKAVATGAAMMGGVLCGQLEEVMLLDIVPLTLGIETYCCK